MPSRKYLSALVFILLILLPILMAVSPIGSGDPMIEGDEVWTEGRDIGSRLVPGQIAGGMNSGGKARVAIVIDDFGQLNATGVKEIFSLGIPITCAVMPNLENTRTHADEAARRGYQVIVHLPLEPVKGKKSWLGPGAITTELKDEEIKSITKKDFDSVPHAVGFNNHMGSAATTSDIIMRPILQLARERNFFVLDSLTTNRSVMRSLSKDIGVPFAERDVFLDNVKNLKYVKRQLRDLSQKALKNGEAIGIGHVGYGGRVTAKALKEMIPLMQKMGIKFVYVSEIAY